MRVTMEWLRPLLEYRVYIHTQSGILIKKNWINKIENIQKKAANFTTNTYNTKLPT